MERDQRRLETLGVGIPRLEMTELSGWLVVIEGADRVGRSTHVNRLRSHLENLGYAVAETGLSRSDLANRGIRRAKQGNTLGTNAFNLFYATDFADRLEHQIVPALRAGFVMLTDRYIYSLIARAVVRGADRDWIKNVYSFALKPDAVFYLRIEARDLVPRTLLNGGFDYWESGMDLPMGEDLYDSFIRYQGRVIEELDTLSAEHNFTVLDAARDVDRNAAELAERVAVMLRGGRLRTLPSAVA
jgi:dTMP kinase